MSSRRNVLVMFFLFREILLQSKNFVKKKIKLKKKFGGR